MEIDELTKQMEKLAKDMPEQLKKIGDRASSIIPVSSRKVVINGMEAVASITQGGFITLEFIDKAHSDIYLNSLELK